MHLTNYSVNKRNRNNYDEGDEIGEKGTKRSLKFLFEHLRRNNIDSAKVWRNIQVNILKLAFLKISSIHLIYIKQKDIILKTLLVSEPYLFHTYKMCRPGQIAGTESVCFEILGFDILIDDTMKPWVIEVNRSPSFGANQQIDFDIKSRLLFESFELLHLRYNQFYIIYSRSSIVEILFNLCFIWSGLRIEWDIRWWKKPNRNGVCTI